ncbi:MAG: hypothetical protein J2P25_10305 [Nocardiopsaceae bacterium]|nr:hypothetical protein [Nocardiopsaceae bacterium]
MPPMTADDPSDAEIVRGLTRHPRGRWEELFALADELAAGTGHVRWEEPRDLGDGSIQLGYPVYSDTVDRIHQLLYELDVIVAFPWRDWDGARRYTTPQAIEAGPVADAARMATVIFRAERFGDGHIASAISDGRLAAILGRLRRFHHEATGP